MEKRYKNVIADTLDSILLRAKTILTLDEDPSISEEDKKIMFEKTNDKMEALVEKLKKATIKH